MKNSRFENKLNEELRIFREYLFPDTKDLTLYRKQFIVENANSNETFKLCNGKKILVINFFADLLRDHYNSGKITEWYKKMTECNKNIIIPNFSSISSIETPYPFGNGINENRFNNFFQSLDYIKTQINNHKEEYDIVLISSGIYTSFIADYIGKINKSFICYGRGLSNIFCIKYKDTYTWCNCDFTKQNLEPYLCEIPKKYIQNDFHFVENGCYW